MIGWYRTNTGPFNSRIRRAVFFLTDLEALFAQVLCERPCEFNEHLAPGSEDNPFWVSSFVTVSCRFAVLLGFGFLSGEQAHVVFLFRPTPPLFI